MTNPSLDGGCKKQLRAEYTARIHRVIDYIQADITGDLTLEKLAKVAGFSPCHVFRSVESGHGRLAARKRLST